PLAGSASFSQPSRSRECGVDSGPARSRWHRASQLRRGTRYRRGLYAWRSGSWQLAHHRIHAAQHDRRSGYCRAARASQDRRAGTGADGRARSSGFDRRRSDDSWLMARGLASPPGVGLFFPCLLAVGGGAPTVLGAWLGGFIYSPVWALLCLALGVGAIAQVVVQILRQMAG